MKDEDKSMHLGRIRTEWEILVVVGGLVLDGAGGVGTVGVLLVRLVSPCN